MSLTVIPIPPQIVIPAAVASVVTTTSQIETTPLIVDTRVPRNMSSSFFTRENQSVNHQQTNPFVGASTSAGISIKTSNVSMGSLPESQFSSTPYVVSSSDTGPSRGSNNVMPDGSTMVVYPDSQCKGDNKRPCYTGVSTAGFVTQKGGEWAGSLVYGNQPVFRKEVLIGLTGQHLYHFSMGSTKSVSNHTSIYYNPLTEKALTGDGHRVSPGFTVSH